MLLSEVPLLSPSQKEQRRRRRFVVKGGRVHQETQSSDQDDASTYVPTTSDIWAGSASVSGPFQMEEERSGGTSYVATCALVDHPQVLLVSTLAENSSSLIPLQSVELDLAQSGLVGGGCPVHVKAFLNQDHVLLVVLDARANVLTLMLQLDDELTPRQDHVGLTSVPGMLLEQKGISYSGGQLYGSHVAVLSPSVVVIGLSPHLLCVDLYATTISFWKEAELPTGAETSSSLAGVVAYMMGTNSSGDAQRDQEPPVSAITSVSVETDLFLIFSLHTDMTVKRWRLDLTGNSSLLPVRVDSWTNLNLPKPDIFWLSTSGILMCSRVYKNGVVALAVHLPSTDGPSFVGAWSCSEGEDSPSAPVILSVPDSASSVSTMEFSSSSQPCSLMVLFADEQQQPSLVVYPSSYNAILSAKPLVPSQAVLESVAKLNYQRIASMSCLQQSQPVTNLKDALHFVDQHYLKQLFRPIYPRGGLQQPLAFLVQRALRKLVPTSTSPLIECSVEVETLRGMHEWRRVDERRTLISATALVTATTTTPKTPSKRPRSVYQQFASPQPPKMEMLMQVADDDKINDTENEEEIADAAREHEQRWIQLCKTVWADEQAILRTPLLLKATASAGNILVRSGILSTLMPTSSSASTLSNKFESLHHAAMSILAKVEDHKEKRSILYEMEFSSLHWITSQAVDSLSEAQSEAHDIVSFITDVAGRLAAWALESPVDASQVEDPDIVRMCKSMSKKEWRQWSTLSALEQPLAGQQALFSALEVDATGNDVVMTTVTNGNGVRSAASHLVLQALDSVRRWTLSRCLLVAAIPSLGPEQNTDFIRPYLHSLAMLWTCGQHVSHQMSPKRHLSLESGSDCLPKGRPITALDTHLMQLQAEVDGAASAVDLARQVIVSAFGSRRTTESSSLYRVLQPEIGILPMPSTDTIVTDHPRLALRLLVPTCLLPPRGETDAMRLLKKETVAECMLMEANAVPSAEAVGFRQRACATLVGQSSSLARGSMDKAFLFLKEWSEKQGQVQGMAMNDSAELAMQAGIQRLLFGLSSSTSVVRPDVRRLCDLPTMQCFLLPLFTASTDTAILERMEDTARELISALFHTLLDHSNQLHRLVILERHLEHESDSNSGFELLVRHADDALQHLERHFSIELLDLMKEYSSLWSRLYRYAEAGHQWKVAVRACGHQANPAWRRLIHAMVQKGAMDELITMCMKEEDASLNLTEIASDAFVSGDGMASERYGTTTTATHIDYLGSLYALHAAKKGWKEAAQAADLRYCSAVSQFDPSSPKSAVQQVASDIALSALATTNVISLVSDPAARYLVSGEFGLLPTLPILEEAKPKSILRRGDSEEDVALVTDRVSRFMATEELKARAIRADVLSILSIDNGAVGLRSLSTLISTSPTVQENRLCVEIAAQAGYFHEAYLLAGMQASEYERRSGASMLAGRDLLHDFLSHFVCTYIVPQAFPTVNDSMDVGPQRLSTLSQVQRAMDQFNSTPTLSLTRTGPTFRRGKDDVASAKIVAAMELLRRIAVAQSTAAKPLAIEVAECALDISGGLPKWLEELLCGSDEDGLFGSIAKHRSNSGDPSALLMLYMRRGMYLEACNVVTQVLGRKNNDRGVLSRLPEKGNIDFVPYNKIDLLWDLIEGALGNGTLESAETLEARNRMEQALERHFEAMKLSEMGMHSARVLGNSG